MASVHVLLDLLDTTVLYEHARTSAMGRAIVMMGNANAKMVSQVLIVPFHKTRAAAAPFIVCAVV